MFRIVRWRLRRAGGTHSGDVGAQAQFLEGRGVEAAAAGQAVLFLEAAHGILRVGIPFTRGIAFVIALAVEGLLNFLDAIRCRRFLDGFAAGARFLLL